MEGDDGAVKSTGLDVIGAESKQYLCKGRGDRKRKNNFQLVMIKEL